MAAEKRFSDPVAAPFKCTRSGRIDSVAGLPGAAHVADPRLDAAAVREPDLTAALACPLDVSGQRIVLADEAGNEGVCRFLVELRRRVALLNDAVIEDGNPVGHGQRFALVVRDVDDRHAKPLMDVPDLQLHVLAQLLVERAQGLIHEHQRRLEDEGARQRDALLLTPGKLLRVAAAEGFHPHHGQRRRNLLLDLRPRQLACGQRKPQVVGDGHVRKQRIVLKHHADVALMRRHAIDDLAVQQDLAGCRRFEAGKHHQAGCLARSGRSQQGEEFAASARRSSDL